MRYLIMPFLATLLVCSNTVFDQWTKAYAQPACRIKFDQSSYYDTDRAEIHVSYWAFKNRPTLDIPIISDSGQAQTTITATNDGAGNGWFWFTGHVQFKPSSTSPDVISEGDLIVSMPDAVTVDLTECEKTVEIKPTLEDVRELIGFQPPGVPNDRIEISATRTPQTYRLSVPITYTVRVHNQSPPNDIPVVVRIFNDTSVVTVDSINADHACSPRGAGEHRCSLGIMTPNQEETFVVTVTPTSDILDSIRATFRACFKLGTSVPSPSSCATVKVSTLRHPPGIPGTIADGTVHSFQKISDTEGNFGGTLYDRDAFGSSVANIGDLDNDGVTDLAVGAPRVLGGSIRGAVWILFMNADGTVKAEQKISDSDGNFGGTLDDYDYFGSSVANIGDLDNDGVADLAVGAPGDNDRTSGIGTGRGAVWILFMNADGTVRAQQKISDTQGNFNGGLHDYDKFGSSVTSIGHLDGDSIADLAVGAPNTDDGGDRHGAIWILFMNANGTVKAQQKISETAGSFGETLNDLNFFGSSLAGIGDLGGNNVPDIAVGAARVSGKGSSWILFMNTDGTVKLEQKISDTEGNFGGVAYGGGFGSSLSGTDDLNRDGVTDIVVGEPFTADGGRRRGAVWVLFLRNDGTVKSFQKISDTEGTFAGALDNDDQFGKSVANIGDLDGNGVSDLAVGASGDDDGGSGRGAVWVLFMKRKPSKKICFITAALHGSHLNGYIHNYRKVKDNALMRSQAGSFLMKAMSRCYYTISPRLTAWVQASTVFKKFVMIAAAPALASFSLLNHLDAASEFKVLVKLLVIIFVNIGIYLVFPLFAIIKIVKLRKKK